MLTKAARSILTSAIVIVGQPMIAAGDLVLDGNEFQANTFTTANQSALRARGVASTRQGRYVVVWATTADLDWDNWSVRAQCYDSAGAASGEEFQVNTYTSGYQYAPAIAAAGDGGFVVAWTSTGYVYPGYHGGQDGSDEGVFAQRYDSAGVPAGSEFRVNSETVGYQYSPAVAAVGDGGFVIVWTSADRSLSLTQDGNGAGIFAQRYDDAGVPIDEEFQVNSSTLGHQMYPLAAGAGDGSFVVVWRDDRQDGSGWGVFGQRYDPEGSALGSEFRVNSETLGYQYAPAVTTLASGSFVVVWTSSDGRADPAPYPPGQDGDGAGIFGQRYDSAGNPVGPEFQINSYTTGEQVSAAVAAADDGGFVVVWASALQDGSDHGIYAKRYYADGEPAGTELQVNSYTTSFQFAPAIAPGIDGTAMVVWNSEGQDGDASGVFGQRLCNDDNSNDVCDGRETARACGDTAGDEGITATDALFVLQVGIGLASCHACVCDTNGSGAIAASDAQRVLADSVGQIVEMLCPPCA